MDLNLNHIWNELTRLSKRIDFVDKKYNITALVDVTMNAARKVVDADRNRLEGYIRTINNRLIELGRIELAQMTKLTKLEKRIDGLQATVEVMEDEIDLLEKLPEEPIQLVPEPISRHGLPWNCSEDAFLKDEFQNFLDSMAMMTGRGASAIFWRIRDKIIPKKG